MTWPALPGALGLVLHYLNSCMTQMSLGKICGLVPAMLRVSALHYSTDSGGFLDSSFSSCAVPTYYCGPEYFYIQCPQVWKLIRTEHSLNRVEHRVIIKLDLFPIF